MGTSRDDAEVFLLKAVVELAAVDVRAIQDVADQLNASLDAAAAPPSDACALRSRVCTLRIFAC